MLIRRPTLHPTNRARTLCALAACAVTVLTATSAMSAVALNYAAYRFAGTSLEALKPGDRLSHGERILLKVSYSNGNWQAEPAGAVVFTLPRGCRLLDVSRTSDLLASIDGGEAYVPVSALLGVRAGTFQSQKGHAVTYLKWRLKEAVAPGASDAISIVARHD